MMIEITRFAMAVGLAILLAATELCVAPASPARANDCAQSCYAQENACRRATKDSPSCSSELTRCLQSCRKSK